MRIGNKDKAFNTKQMSHDQLLIWTSAAVCATVVILYFASRYRVTPWKVFCYFVSIIFVYFFFLFSKYYGS